MIFRGNSGNYITSVFVAKLYLPVLFLGKGSILDQIFRIGEKNHYSKDDTNC